jgi:hypothetical protein
MVGPKRLLIPLLLLIQGTSRLKLLRFDLEIPRQDIAYHFLRILDRPAMSGVLEREDAGIFREFSGASPLRNSRR